MDSYTEALIREIRQWGGKTNRPIDTVYFGGGTPALLEHRLEGIMRAVRESFSISGNAEITLEMNPGGNTDSILEHAAESGVNRLSIGAQCGIDRELKAIGRRHTVSDTVTAVEKARSAGFDNISLDIMLGLPDSDENTLSESLGFIKNLDPEHISAYILKIEPNTVFGKKAEALNLPDDDRTAEQYLQVCENLKKSGYRHYEISNFAVKNRESRHNLKYWRLDEYLGIGPGAHSLLNNERFYYKRDLKAFINGCDTMSEGPGGTAEEYIMLRLRLAEGLDISRLKRLYDIAPRHDFYKKCHLFEENGLLRISGDNVSLTDRGMLLSNSIITEFLENIL